jgi:co-chaperonin GroES (HSP10)
LSTRANVIDLAKCFEPEQQKQAILDKLGGIEIDVLSSQVIVATYIEPEKTSGGILLPEKRLDESRFQGKVGLVVKMGPSAFKYDGAYNWEGKAPQIGDWVVYRASDAWENAFGGIFVRWIESDMIKGIVKDPRVVY